MDIKTLRKWREAHPNLDVSDESVGAIEDFPSLRANDYLTLLRMEGDHMVADFVEGLARETAWAYHLAAKAQSQSKAEDVLEALMNECRTEPVIRKFIADYAKANNIRVLG